MCLEMVGAKENGFLWGMCGADVTVTIARGAQSVPGKRERWRSPAVFLERGAFILYQSKWERWRSPAVRRMFQPKFER